jgi:hypothetical protein
MVCGSRGAIRKTGRQGRACSACAETFLASLRMGYGKTEIERETREDRLEELAAKVAEKGVQDREIGNLVVCMRHAFSLFRCFSSEALQ